MPVPVAAGSLDPGSLGLSSGTSSGAASAAAGLIQPARPRGGCVRRCRAFCLGLSVGRCHGFGLGLCVGRWDRRLFGGGLWALPRLRQGLCVGRWGRQPLRRRARARRSLPLRQRPSHRTPIRLRPRQVPPGAVAFGGFVHCLRTRSRLPRCQGSSALLRSTVCSPWWIGSRLAEHAGSPGKIPGLLERRCVFRVQMGGMTPPCPGLQGLRILIRWGPRMLSRAGARNNGAMPELPDLRILADAFTASPGGTLARLDNGHTATGLRGTGAELRGYEGLDLDDI